MFVGCFFFFFFWSSQYKEQCKWSPVLISVLHGWANQPANVVHNLVFASCLPCVYCCHSKKQGFPSCRDRGHWQGESPSSGHWGMLLSHPVFLDTAVAVEGQWECFSSILQPTVIPKHVKSAKRSVDAILSSWELDQLTHEKGLFARSRTTYPGYSFCLTLYTWIFTPVGLQLQCFTTNK